MHAALDTFVFERSKSEIPQKGQIRVLDHIVTEAEIVRQLQITQRAGASAKPYGVTTKSTE